MLQLLKQPIDDLVAQDQQLQAFLTWVSQKSCAVPCAYQLVSVRAFYFDLALARSLGLVGGNLELALALNRTLTRNLECHLALDLALDRVLALDIVVVLTRDPIVACECILKRALAHARALEPMLELALLQLKAQLPDNTLDRKRFKQWWSAEGSAWTEQLRAVIIEYRNIGHDWQLSHQQWQALLRYYDANLRLVNSLNSDSDLTKLEREEMKKTLLLPESEIELLDSPK